MSLKLYILSVLLAVSGFIVQHYTHEDLPLPIAGYRIKTDWLFPPHCMLFAAALVVNLVTTEATT
ncbi:hypothetical protein V8C35DRAFT_318620 [Trichoderma chlorosporum]